MCRCLPWVSPLPCTWGSCLWFDLISPVCLELSAVCGFCLKKPRCESRGKAFKHRSVTGCQGTVAVARTHTWEVRSIPLSSGLQKAFVTSDEKTTQVKSDEKLKMPACGGRDVSWCWAYMCIFNPDQSKASRLLSSSCSHLAGISWVCLISLKGENEGRQ